MAAQPFAVAMAWRIAMIMCEILPEYRADADDVSATTPAQEQAVEMALTYGSEVVSHSSETVLALEYDTPGWGVLVVRGLIDSGFAVWSPLDVG